MDQPDDAAMLGQANCGKKANASKISQDELRRHFEECVKGTKSLTRSQESFTAFIVGFRMYERMAMELGKPVTEEESRRFVRRYQMPSA